MKEYSKIMKVAMCLGLDSIAWSLRRLHCPVTKKELVLEVGSGGNPYYRSNVLIDAYEETRERHWVPLISDRPLVIGFVESLPFKNNTFDFVIASHVFEHTRDPENFLKELMRVSKAGYIEVPDAIMERLNPYYDHRIEITKRDNILIINKKISSIVDPYLVELYENRIKSFFTRETIRKHPFDFHVRHYWSETIDYKILNSEVETVWEALDTCRPPYTDKLSIFAKIKKMTLIILRKILSQNIRNNKIDLKSFLACPKCKSENLIFKEVEIQCLNCNQDFQIKDGIPHLY